MGYFQSFIRQFRARLFVVMFINNMLIFADWYVVDQVVKLTGWWTFAAIIAMPLITLGVIPWLTTRTLTQPTKFLWQAIMHLAPGTTDLVSAPIPEQLHLGRELVTNLIGQLYQLTSVVQGLEQSSAKAAQDLHFDFVAQSLPLPLIVLDKNEKIVYANEATAKYLNKPVNDLTSQDIYTLLDISFATKDTLRQWLQVTKGKSVTASHRWERVRTGLPGEANGLQFDLAAYYNQDNPQGYETMLVLFDHTQTYGQDDASLSFVALSVHELRTPLTLLRGYIEVFKEEVGPNLDPELQRFMEQMDASAQQLAAFVDNILNVTKIEDNQLTLQLHEENWADVVNSVVDDMKLRSRVRGIEIELDIAKDLPPAGADRFSIYEVLANLLDNAIKYSKEKDTIKVSAHLNSNGLIETSVRDRGMGIDGSILPHIFDKFYRNHRNRSQIGGTGLGLYIAKAIIDAHGGNIWVNSKSGEGSTFTFTVMPYAKLKETSKVENNTDITRSAHGWIKNHSLYRD
jgi:signal transduction histidine kinase